MAEKQPRGEDLLKLSTRDLARRYKEVPLGLVQELPWLDESSRDRVGGLLMWVEARVPEIEAGEITADDFEPIFSEEVELLREEMSLPGDRHCVERLHLFGRAKIWSAEVLFLYSQIEMRGEVKYQLEYAIEEATRLIMAFEIFDGARSEAMNKMVIENLKWLKLEEEAEEIVRSSQLATRKGEHGMRNASLN